MSTQRKVAVVSGSKKGIGYAIVRGLCKQFDGDVYLTARNEELGKQAIEELKKEGINPKFHQLDITDEASITRLKEFLQRNYNGLDILINNAGMSYKAASTAPFSEQAQVTVKTNFWGTLNMCNALYPLLRPHARVVIVSSLASRTAIKKCSEELQKKLRSSEISMDELCKLMQSFVDSAQVGKHGDKGWPNSAYGVSKIGTTVMSYIQQRQFDKDSRADIVVNACCPGYVATDLTSHKGGKTIDQGADTPIYLAMLPQGITSPKGQIVSERKIEQI